MPVLDLVRRALLRPFLIIKRKLDPVKLRLLSLDAAITLLKLSTSLYPPGFWSKSNQEESEESWLLRSGISSWTWRVISELRDIKDDGTVSSVHGDILLTV
jgi:hypothetical protein